MKTTILACALLSVAMSASAKDQLIPLPDADASALHGKTVALTVHARPTFIAMTAGKASFAIFGVGAMAAAGNKLVDDDHVPDPAGIVQSNLASLLRDVDGMQLMPVDTAPTKAEKPAAIAATHPEADYVLDVRSGGWNFAYFPTQWGRYWIGYSVQVQLIDVKSGKQVTNAACNTSTQANHNPPTLEQIQGNGAKLLKDVTAALGWNCVQLLATQQFRVAADKIPATPVEYVDPLAALSASSAPAATTAKESASSPSGATPQVAPTSSDPGSSSASLPASTPPSTPAPTTSSSSSGS